MAPFYSRTIAKNTVSSCGDCHGNANVVDLDADSAIKVVEWDGNGPEFGDKVPGRSGRPGTSPCRSTIRPR